MAILYITETRRDASQIGKPGDCEKASRDPHRNPYCPA